MRMLLFVLAGALMVAGCGGGDGQNGGQANSTSTSGSGAAATETPLPPVTIPSPTPTSLAPGLPVPTASLPLPVPPNPSASQVDPPSSLLDQIKADAAQRGGVAREQVQVISSTAQTWSDGSLGCPKPGENYIQVMVEGFQVIVQAGGRALDYRTSSTGIRLCEQY